MVDKLGLKDTAGALAHTAGRIAESCLRRGDSVATAADCAVAMILGDTAKAPSNPDGRDGPGIGTEQKLQIPLGGGGEPPSADDPGDADTLKLQPVAGEPTNDARGLSLKQ